MPISHAKIHYTLQNHVDELDQVDLFNAISQHHGSRANGS